MSAPHPSIPAPAAFPLVSIEGSPYDCGRQYAQFVLRHYPGYRRYFDMAFDWNTLSPAARALVQARAPYLIDLYRGLLDAAAPAFAPPPQPRAGCTSFAIANTRTAHGQPLAGQTKDTPPDRLPFYIVLRLRMNPGPSLLVLAYPGEILGYGLWSTGMSLFRNDLNAKPSTSGKLSLVQWGLLALAATSVHQGAELAEEFGIADAGNCLLADASGESLSVEFSANGVAIIPAANGLAIHANHPLAQLTAPAEEYPDPIDREHSRYRVHRLRALFDRQGPSITPASAFTALADHGEHGRGVCRHLPESTTGIVTTAAVIAQPKSGTLHVVPGQPCQNRATIYSF